MSHRWRHLPPTAWALLLVHLVGCSVQSANLGQETKVGFQRQNIAATVGFTGADLGEVFERFSLDKSDLTLNSQYRDELGLTVERYSQVRNGLLVVNGDVHITRDASNNIRWAGSVTWGSESVSHIPSILADGAQDIAMSMTDGATDAASPELVYVAPSDGSEPVLAWRVLVHGFANGLPLEDDVFVDAHLGTVADRHPHIHSALHRETFDAGYTETFGTLIRKESSNAVGNVDVDRAHEIAGDTYACLHDLFGRDSYDDSGSTLTSIANFGEGYKNAFWSEQNKLMAYGSGYAIADIGTHEIGHAVTSSTAKLVYRGESGALNEAWSDIFAAVCQAHKDGGVSPATWVLGEDLFSGAFRHMNDPKVDGISRSHYSERYLGDEDHGGVHSNSGIVNLVFYLVSQGGVHPDSGMEVTGIGIEAAGQIFYRALTTYMSPNTNFLGARAATELASHDLFGEGSAEANSIKEAWIAAGVGGVESPLSTGSNSDDNTGTKSDGPQPIYRDGREGAVTNGCSTTGTGRSTQLVWFLIAFALIIRRRSCP